jgi:hypothetical protein
MMKLLFSAMNSTTEWFRMVHMYATFRGSNYNIKTYINCLFRNIHSYKIWIIREIFTFLTRKSLNGMTTVATRFGV